MKCNFYPTYIYFSTTHYEALQPLQQMLTLFLTGNSVILYSLSLESFGFCFHFKNGNSLKEQIASNNWKKTLSSS